MAAAHYIVYRNEGESGRAWLARYSSFIDSQIASLDRTCVHSVRRGGRGGGVKEGGEEGLVARHREAPLSASLSA